MIQLSGPFSARSVGVSHISACCAAACLMMLSSVVRADDITYGYDALGRLTSVTVAGATAYYDYDAAGNITAIRRQGALSAAKPLSDAGSSPASDAGKSPVSAIATQASVR
jgi:YD repeat-containing protein